MGSHFYAMMSRMKYINRWALMRNSYQENVSEHSLEVSMIAHALAIIGNKRLCKNLNAEKAALIGVFHDSTEIITGDMPTPIKYYNSGINEAFKEIEDAAARKLLNLLPEDLRGEYETIFFKDNEDEYLWRLVKAADKISALIKCIEEGKAGNNEFVQAKNSIAEAIKAMKIEEAEIFLKEFLPSYELTLDDLH